MVAASLTVIFIVVLLVLPYPSETPKSMKNVPGVSVVHLPFPVSVSKSVKRSVILLHENFGMSSSASDASQSTCTVAPTVTSLLDMFVIVIGLLGICVFCATKPVDFPPMLLNA